jgi:predicted ABC-type ATPase
MSEKPILTVFAGANGSGKSTIVKTVLQGNNCPGEFICPDNIVAQSDKHDREAYVEAMRLAEMYREDALFDGLPFSFETVLSTREKVDFIRKAKSSGYQIQVYYVLTENVDINIERVKIRVAHGGHDVPTDKLKSRYERAMSLMPEVLKLADLAFIYDNSGDKPQFLMSKYSGDSVVVEMDNMTCEKVQNVIVARNNLPEWFKEKYYKQISEALK